MAIGLVGKKSGMTRVFTEEGVSIPVTVIEVEPNRVTQIKTADTDGYVAIQVTTGLFSVDIDGLESGPLAVLVSFETGRQFADIHEFNFNFLAGLIGLHITAIAIYHFVLKERLVAPMLTGRRSRTDFSATELPENNLRLFPVTAAAVLSLIGIIAISNFG